MKTHSYRPIKYGDARHERRTWCGRTAGRVIGTRYGAFIATEPTCTICRARVSRLVAS